MNSLKSKPHFRKAPLLLRTAIVASVSGYGLTANADGNLAPEEMIFTATKRVESLQDVSVSVSAVGADCMQDAGISDMVDIAQHVPALTVTLRFCTHRLFDLRRLSRPTSRVFFGE